MAQEVVALGELATTAAVNGVDGIEQVHRAVARRVWRALGPVARPVRAVHDVVTGATYGAVRAGLAAGGTVVAVAVGGVAGVAGRREPSSTAVGGAALAVLNGFFGDHLDRAGSDLAIPMTVHPGRPPADATGDVVVFVHGLVETDRSWSWGARRQHGDREVTYGSLLAADLGMTPLYVRYNTGLPVAENGRRLDAVLDRTVAEWPVDVHRLTLVGHSMGGLVVRSACHAGSAAGSAWVPLVRHAVYLGTPHLGAPLARAAMSAGSLLTRVPEARPFASLLARPSAGVRDLRHGVVAGGEDGGDPADWLDVPLLPGCRHHAVAASLTRRGDSLLDRLAGDLLVHTASATGRGRPGRTLDFVAEEGVSLAGLHHFSLLNHPAVYERLRSWLDDGTGRA
jgi:PGAP1-like protein